MGESHINFIQIRIRGGINFTYETRPAKLDKFIRFAGLVKEMCLLFNESENGMRKIIIPKQEHYIYKNPIIKSIKKNSDA